MKNFIKGITSSKFIITIQFIATVAVCALLYILNMLPLRYYLIVVGVLFVLFILFFFMTKEKNNTRTKGKAFAKMLSLLISITLAFASLYIIQGNTLLTNITGGDVEVNSISVIVMKDSPVETIEDLTNKTYGYNTSIDTENINLAISEIEKAQTNFTATTYTNFNNLADALYDNKVDAIIVNEAYRSLLEVNYPNFDSETRVVWTHAIEEKVENTAKEVNVTNTPFNIYISGIDTYGSVASVSRTDVNMIVTINPNTKEVLMTSIPRDYYVPLDFNGQMDKLTHSGIYGVNESVATLENLFGIEINYYARVNFTSVLDIVDALGGVDVYVDQPATLSSVGKTLQPGTIHMDGATALAFSRERYSYTDGDNQRVRNQQAVLTGIINKMTSPAIITNYSSLLASIDGSFETNMSSNDIQSLIKMQLDEGGSWTITQQQVSGSGGYDSVYSIPGFNAYVMYPDDTSVNASSAAIYELMK